MANGSNRSELSRPKGEKRGLTFGSKGNGAGDSISLLPARMNRNKWTGSLDRMTKGFIERHGKAAIEYGATVDAYGYVTTYQEGSSGSVGFPKGIAKGDHIIHNHPHRGWGNFSGTDLETFANTEARGMSAVSLNTSVRADADASTKQAYSNRRAGDYRISKTNHFDRDGFVKAIHQIQVQDNNYDKDLHRWLVTNQKKYGYKYSYMKAKNKV